MRHSSAYPRDLIAIGKTPTHGNVHAHPPTLVLLTSPYLKQSTIVEGLYEAHQRSGRYAQSSYPYPRAPPAGRYNPQTGLWCVFGCDNICVGFNSS